MVVGARQAADLSVSQTADQLGFSQRHNHLQGLQKMVSQRENIQRGAAVCEEETAWLKSGVGGDWLRLCC